MTEQEAVNALLAWWRNQIGYHEGANNYTKYAEDAGLAKLYGWKPQGEPWCDIIYDAGTIACFGLEAASKLTYQPIGQGSALCRQSAQYYKDNGAWYTEPQAGDQIFFIYDGAINHTGIVESVENGLVRTIEGNTSDMVARRSYSLNYSTNYSAIAGYGRPNWSIFSNNDTDSGTIGDNTTPSAPSVPKQETCSVAITLPVIKYGDASMWVKLMQTALIGRGFNCGWYGADGEYGQQTKIALFQFQQKNADKCGLDDGKPDCVCGKNTWVALLKC